MRPIHRGIQSQARTGILACLLGVTSNVAADPVEIEPDPPPRSAPAPAPVLAPTWDLDGLYLWLGPNGAAGVESSQWDSAIGGDASLVRVREHELIGAVGASLGAARWTARGGGRAWLDGVIGTPAFGWMFGVSAGPIVEMSDVMHPRIGGSVGLWAFVGVTPYARFGAVDGLGTFAEVGLHIALPVIRKRR